MSSRAAMPTSPEFMTLCQAQVALLTRGLGAALTIVYLTEDLAVGDTQLLPIVAYPEAAANWGEEQILAFLAQVGANLRQRLLTASLRYVPTLAPSDQLTPQLMPHLTQLPQSTQLPQQTELKTEFTAPLVDSADSAGQGTDRPQSSADQSRTDHAVPTERLLPQQQIVMPLIYQERVMGLLLTARAERAWNESEQMQIEQIAQTLTMACGLDRRARWLTQDLHRQQLLEERKTDLYDDLLHQFRNPLTALRTFGKLLVKRLSPADANRSVVESIVRESDRLQELLKQLDNAIDLDVEDLVPDLVPQLSAAGSAEPQPVPLSTLGLTVVDPSQEPVPAQSHQTLHQAPQQALQLPEARLLLGSAIDLQPHLLTEVLHPLLDSAIAIAQDRQLTLQVNIPINLPPVQIDTRALREVVNNLIDNALKYTPAAGLIYVAVQRHLQHDSQDHSQPDAQRNSQQAFQSLLVADTGPGIPSADLAHLFTRHYRGVQANTNIPGTGLGLAIARDLVRQMQGEIQIFSPAVSSGMLPPELVTRETSGTAAVVWLAEALT